MLFIKKVMRVTREGLNQPKKHSPPKAPDIGFETYNGKIELLLNHCGLNTPVISLPLIQEGQLSVSGERMCTILVSRLED